MSKTKTKTKNKTKKEEEMKENQGQTQEMFLLGPAGSMEQVGRVYAKSILWLFWLASESQSVLGTIATGIFCSFMPS